MNCFTIFSYSDCQVVKYTISFSSLNTSVHYDSNNFYFIAGESGNHSLHKVSGKFISTIT